MASAFAAKPLDPAKFRNPFLTAAGDDRAAVTLGTLRTLWFNTGTLCNITCGNCYIESSPRNDRLVYLSAAEVAAYLDEIQREGMSTEEIGFTGGEPFMNPAMPAMLEDALDRGFRALVLTNAMRPMQRHKAMLLRLRERFGDRLLMRVSLDHYTRERHEAERGPRTWEPALDGLRWLAANGFAMHVAGRTFSGEAEEELRAGFTALFAEHHLPVDANDPIACMLFPEMDPDLDVPEITTACWGILKLSPDAMMCASSRMIVKRKGAERPSIVACTPLPYDEQFDLGPDLATAERRVPLNSPHCARFCVLGGGACSKA